MQLRITHTTGYEYDGPATASYNEARLTPVNGPGQIVSHSRLDISPVPWSYTYRDYFDLKVTAFEIAERHSTLTVVSHATVHTDRTAPSGPILSWDEVRDPDLADEHVQYLISPDLVAPDEELTERVRQIAAEAAAPDTAAREVCALIHREMDYQLGATDTKTTAAAAWQQRAGVCQDMAHVAIGALRAIQIPARYVSGYLHPAADAPIGETVTGESHSWVEWWDGAWVGFDPTNNEPIGDRHVVVGAGRDYTDVKPLRGLFSGAPTSCMFVEVEITRVS